MNDALRQRRNWEQLLKFCVVGASGYVVNLAVYALLAQARRRALHPGGGRRPSSSPSRTTTRSTVTGRFARQRGHVAYQGLRFLVVSTVRLLANLGLLPLLVGAGVGKILGQAIAIVLVTPLNFIGNKLWSFRRR